MSLNLNDIVASKGAGAPILEAGTYPARIVQIIDLGLQLNTFEPQKPPRPRVRITYELVSEFLLDEEGNEDETKPRWIGEAFFLSNISNDAGTSTKRIKVFDPTNTTNGDLTACVGLPCMVTVAHQQPKDPSGKPYAKVSMVTPPPRGFPIPELVNDPLVFLLDDGNVEAFDSLIGFVQDDIKAAVNFEDSALSVALAGGQEDNSGY